MIIKQKILQEIENVLVLMSEIRLYQGVLTEEELSFVSRAAPKRVREFTAGRHLARSALREMGVAVASIPVSPNRYPVWPDGIVGSISHTDDNVGVALARVQDFISVGFDIEICGAVKPDLYDIILSDDEKKRINLDAEPDFATLVFGCKESVYKAVYPLVDEFLEFQDIQIEIADDRFSACCINDGRSRAYVAAGQGYFETHDDMVKTLFVIE